MKDIVKSIKASSIITICNNNYKAVAMSRYVTESNPTDIYIKVFFENHFALVMSPSDGFMYFGKDVGELPYNFPTPDVIEHDGLRYNKTDEDYQIVNELVFGSPLNTEGEVKFIDYECEEDEGKLISVGLIIRNSKRADIVAKTLEMKDIELNKDEEE